MKLDKYTAGVVRAIADSAASMQKDAKIWGAYGNKYQMDIRLMAYRAIRKSAKTVAINGRNWEEKVIV